MILLAALLCNYGRGFCLIDIGTEGFAYYNFCRVHSSLRVTPAMEAGISNHVWDIEDIIGLLS